MQARTVAVIVGSILIAAFIHYYYALQIGAVANDDNVRAGLAFGLIATLAYGAYMIGHRLI